MGIYMLTNDDWHLPIPKLLRVFRAKHDLSQIELAEHIHHDNKTISRWESGIGFKEDVRLILKGLELDLMR